MHLEKYLSDLDEFVKYKLTEFLSEYYIHAEDPEKFPSASLKEFMEKELEKVTFKVENAYIIGSDESMDHTLKVNLTMGDDNYSTYLRVKKNVMNMKKSLKKY